MEVIKFISKIRTMRRVEIPDEYVFQFAEVEKRSDKKSLFSRSFEIQTEECGRLRTQMVRHPKPGDKAHFHLAKWFSKTNSKIGDNVEITITINNNKWTYGLRRMSI